MGDPSHECFCRERELRPRSLPSLYNIAKHLFGLGGRVVEKLGVCEVGTQDAHE
jgi:hypothetical protein